MAIPTDLIVQQWMSPAFPVGGFAYSHGLETFAPDMDAPGLEAWLSDILTHGAGWSDAALMAAIFQGHDVQDVDDLARALAPSSERLLETTQQGAAFAQNVNAVWGLTLPPLCYAVALAAAAQQMDVAPGRLIPLYLQTFVSTLTQAAIRLSIVTPTQAQKITQRLAVTCMDVAKTAETSDLADIGSAAFLVDIASMRHEALQPRIFRS